MKVAQLKELIQQVVKEEADYKQLFKTMLSKTGKDISTMNDDQKKTFFNAVDRAYKAKSEGRLTGYNENLPGNQDVLDTDKDGEIEASDLEKLRSKNEVAPEGWEKTVKAMKDEPNIDNVYALANWMKNQGYKSHK
jgi:hypothetical protein